MVKHRKTDKKIECPGKAKYLGVDALAVGEVKARGADWRILENNIKGSTDCERTFLMCTPATLHLTHHHPYPISNYLWHIMQS